MMEIKPKIKIMLLDDHEIIRKGMEVMFSPVPHIEIIGSFSKSANLFLAIKESMPDLVLLDLSLPDMGGDIVADRLLKTYPDLKIIILTSNPSAYTAKQLLQLGVKGYLFKNIEHHLLIGAIQVVYDGLTYISPELQSKFVSFSKETKKDKYDADDFTSRELDIIKLIIKEYTSQEIADKLGLSQRTIENYRFSIMQKMGVKSMVGLVKKALLLGLNEM